MLTGADVQAISMHVTDAGGVHPLKPIAADGAQAIADECNAHPLYREVAIAGTEYCAGLYVVHSFRESGWNLLASGDHGKSHGPFQVQGRAPTSWKDAVAQFAPLLKRASVCPEPLEMLAAGKCGTDVGARISRAREALAREVIWKWRTNP